MLADVEAAQRHGVRLVRDAVWPARLERDRQYLPIRAEHSHGDDVAAGVGRQRGAAPGTRSGPLTGRPGASRDRPLRGSVVSRDWPPAVGRSSTPPGRPRAIASERTPAQP